MDELLNRFNFLRDSLSVITLLMVGFISLSVYVFYINRKIRLKNRELREINKKEEEQRRKQQIHQNLLNHIRIYPDTAVLHVRGKSIGNIAHLRHTIEI